MLFLALLVLSVVVLVYALKRKNSDYWKKRNVVQAEGILWKFMVGDRSLPEYYKEIYDAYDTNVGIFLGSKPALILKDIEDVQAVFAGDFQSFSSRGILVNSSDVLADNLLFIQDFQRWKCFRQKLSPVFTSSKLKNMFYIMDKCAKDFVEILDSDVNMKDSPFNALFTYTTASIAASVFGIDIKTKTSTMEKFMDIASRAVEPTFESNVKVFISNSFPNLFKKLNLKFFEDSEEFFIGAVRSVMESRRCSTEKRHDFIEICLELQKEGIIKDPQTRYEIELSVEVLAAQAFFFFIAGADTTATTMHFLLLQLADHQDVLSKVHEEIDAVFQNGMEQLTYNDIEKLQYLDMVLSESMRMYPNIASLQRKCTKDTVLPGSKIKINKDTIVVIPVFGIHRDEKYYPNPDVFDPERFAPSNSSNIKNYSYLPFGEGNRICIGNRYARLQIKAGIAWLLRRYTLAEQKYAPKKFERSPFSIRDSKARYELIRRDV